VVPDVLDDLASGDQRHGQFAAANLGAVQATVVHVSPATAARRPRYVLRRTGTDAYRLVFVVSGDCVVEQDHRRTALGRGDYMLCDTARPAFVSFSRSVPNSLMMLVIPREFAARSAPLVARMTGVAVGGRTGAGALVSSMLTQLARNLDGYHAVEGVRIATALLDLVGAACAGPAERPAADRRDALRNEVFAFIEHHLGERDLSPRLIAAAHHISVRYLYKLFQNTGYTVAGWIRHRRLEQCRRNLADPALADRPVGAIGLRWGFTDAAHFSRSFRTAYRMPPADYRHSMQRARAGGVSPLALPG
jgi:AraC-like DNA-binding protein